MRTLRYAVLQIGDEWKVVCQRRRIGHYATRTDAVRTGAALAREALAEGCSVELMVQGEAGELHAECFEHPEPKSFDPRGKFQ